MSTQIFVPIQFPSSLTIFDQSEALGGVCRDFKIPSPVKCQTWTLLLFPEIHPYWLQNLKCHLRTKVSLQKFRNTYGALSGRRACSNCSSCTTATAATTGSISGNWSSTAKEIKGLEIHWGLPAQVRILPNAKSCSLVYWLCQ